MLLLNCLVVPVKFSNSVKEILGKQLDSIKSLARDDHAIWASIDNFS